MGVPSFSVPVTTVCQARTGLCCAAYTTFTASAPPAFRSVRFAASDFAVAPDTVASVDGTAILSRLARMTCTFPLSVSATTRSPPTTGSPA